MRHIPTRPQIRTTFAAAALAALLLAPALDARAQDRSPGFLDNLFNRGEGQPGQGQPEGQPGPRGIAGQGDAADPSDMAVRLDRIENALRQLTGTVEELQHRNQQLESQINRMQGGQGPGPGPGPGQTPPQGGRSGPPSGSPPTAPGRRSDVFVPSQHPDAPGAPRALGNVAVAAPGPQGNQQFNSQLDRQDDRPVGAPGGRAAGAPLDLSTLSANSPQVPAGNAPAGPIPVAEPVTSAPMPQAQGASNSQLPPVMRGTAAPSAPGQRLATLPPSATPQDEYDMAYGYVLHKDYALAEQAFRDFLRKYPDERLMPDAQYWLGESLFQRQRFRDAAEAFLAVSTKYEHSGKAPDSLLRLGQSLAALKQKEAACATLGEVGRKYPKASSSVKRGVAAEIKRAHC